MPANSYVYVLFDWRGIPRYVGRGRGDRWLQHERKTDPTNWLKNEFIERTWIIMGELPKIKSREHLTVDQAISTEIALIQAIGRIDLGTGPLTNLTDGGDGAINPNQTFRDAAGARFSRAMLEWWASNTEAKAALAARNRLLFTGRKLSAEHKANISAGGRGIPKPAHWKAHMSVLRSGIPMSEEAKANMRHPKSERGRANIHASMQTRQLTPHRPNHSIALTAAWRDPVKRERMLAARTKHLSSSQIADIQYALAKGERVISIAHRYDVSLTMIYQIRNKKGRFANQRPE